MQIIGSTFKAEFSLQINNFIHLVHTHTGDDFIKSVPNVPLIALYALDKSTKEKIELLPAKGEPATKDGCQIVTYKTFGGRKVEVILHLKANEDRMLIWAEITNQEAEIDIVEVLCPHISGIYLGESYEDDAIIYPHHAGERTLNPIKEYGTEKNLGFWRAGSEPYGDIFRREINYCGLASMSWMYYYDAQNGLYIGSHDARYPVTGIIAESGTEKTPYMGLGFRKHHRIRQGETYHTGEYCIAVSEKDWHYGAQLYREYIVPQLDLDHTPAFLEEEYALNQCYNFKRTGVVENKFKDIPKLFDEGKSWGVRHMFLASWNRTGFDSYYPEYYPDMELGSAMEFRRGLEYVRNNGGFSTLYINARIFDLKSDFHKLVGENMALRDAKGNMLYETYGPESFTVSCPSDKLWRDYLIDTAEFAMKAYGCDGIYLDQLASAEPFACYCEEHSHENIGEFNNGYVYVLKELLRRLKEYNPNAYLMTENCGDIYGSYTWGNLTWNGADYDEHYNVFKYTFPEFVQVNMVNPRGWEEDEQKKYTWFFRDMQRTILLGNVLWMGITTRLTPHAGEYHTYAKEALSFRKNIQPYLHHAQFKDDLWIDSIAEGCDATCWELEDGKLMILCGNADLTEKGSATVKLPKACTKQTIYDLSWAAQENNLATGQVTINLENQRLLCVIFE